MTTKSNQKIAALCEELTATGWREYPSGMSAYKRCFYKRFDTATPCHQNNDKPGVAIKIGIADSGDRAPMELELCAELRDGTWLMLLNYGLPKTIREVTAMIPRLLAIWESACKFDAPEV